MKDLKDWRSIRRKPYHPVRTAEQIAAEDKQNAVYREEARQRDIERQPYFDARKAEQAREEEATRLLTSEEFDKLMAEFKSNKG